MKHKHSEVLKAWADGIECQGWDHAKKDWYDITNMSSFDFCDDARIKPTPKPNIVEYMRIMRVQRDSCIAPEVAYYSNKPKFNCICNLVLTFDGETGELKSAEVI
jgi:hypothetical protein